METSSSLPSSERGSPCDRSPAPLSIGRLDKQALEAEVIIGPFLGASILDVLTPFLKYSWRQGRGDFSILCLAHEAHRIQKDWLCISSVRRLHAQSLGALGRDNRFVLCLMFFVR